MQSIVILYAFLMRRVSQSGHTQRGQFETLAKVKLVEGKPACSLNSHQNPPSILKLVWVEIADAPDENLVDLPANWTLWRHLIWLPVRVCLFR